MRRKPRQLSTKEHELWTQVAQTTQPLHPPTAHFAPTAEIPPQKKMPKRSQNESAQEVKWTPLPKVDTANKQHVICNLYAQKTNAAAPLRIDAKAHKKMRQGKLKPTARLDLHGDTLASAHRKLTQFVLNAHKSGHRLILVITGKGRTNSPSTQEPRGLLRAQLPHWLSLPPTSHVILNISTAHLRHGGDGAYYIYLKNLNK